MLVRCLARLLVHFEWHRRRQNFGIKFFNKQKVFDARNVFRIPVGKVFIELMKILGDRVITTRTARLRLHVLITGIKVRTTLLTYIKSC